MAAHLVGPEHHVREPRYDLLSPDGHRLRSLAQFSRSQTLTSGAGLSLVVIWLQAAGPPRPRNARRKWKNARRNSRNGLMRM
jgi:hypothetical protein